MPYLRRDPFILKLWSLDFAFAADTPLAHVFVRGQHQIIVPKVEQLDEEWARVELERCELPLEIIDRLLKAA